MHMSDAGGRADPTEMLEMDWSHSPRACRQHYTTSLNLESRVEKKIGRLRNTWRRYLEADVKETGYTGRQFERLAQDRSAWMSHVGGLCPEGATKALID